MATEELELVTIVSSSNYWGTYSNFYTDQENSVEISDALVKIADRELSCRHELISDCVEGLSSSLGTISSFHTVLGPELKILSDDTAHANGSTHDIMSEIPAVVVVAVTADTFHDMFSSQVAISFAPILNGVDDVSHDIESSSPSPIARILINSVHSTIHEMFDSGWNDIHLIHTLRVMASSHEHYGEGWLLVGESGEYVFPRSSFHDIEDSGAGALSMREVIHTVRGSIHYSTASQTGPMPAVYMIDADDCEHIILSDNVSPDFITPDSAHNAVTSSLVWDWDANSYQEVLSPEVSCIPTVNTTSCHHSFKVKADVLLGLSIIADDCLHRVFTKDTIPARSCSHDLTSELLQSNNWYRRIYV